MSHLLRNIRSIICIFEKYAKDDGDCGTLSKGELKQLIQTELTNFVASPRDKKKLDAQQLLLDINGDSLVDFNEYLIFVFQIAKGCYRFLQ
uniref:S100/CaBP-9k-type calcium binding subdomain domain-containing protein n=1 Tax=Pseudonaja textilis TaxID=8673 RepID=A0A670Z5J9_PSETE